MSSEMLMLKQCIGDIVEQAEAVNGESQSPFRDAKILAYNEILSILKTNLTPLDLSEFGLDFDIDKRFA
jgi:hypothetical protein